MTNPDGMTSPDGRSTAAPDKATRRWFEDFTVELRLLDVPGASIGDAVASAREFLADAGGTPGDVFGDPREYALSLELPRSRTSPAALAALLVPTCLGLLGFFGVAAAVGSADASVEVTVSGFMLVLTALLVAACAPVLLGFIVRRPIWQAVLAGGTFGALQVLAALLAGDVVLFALPALPTALIGGMLLLATSLWGQFRKGPAADPILDPVTGPPHRPFGSTLLIVVSNWMLFLSAAAISAWFLLRT